SEYWENGDLTWFSPTDLSKANNLVLLDSTNKITEKGLAKSSAKLMQPNSFMMTSRATIGLFGIFNKPFATNQGFINVTPHKKEDKYYLLFNFKFRVPEFYNHASGAIFPEISKSNFKRLKIQWPSDELLVTWHNIVSPIIDSISNLTEQNKRLKEARDILLPRLMTGMINVDHIELPIKEEGTEAA
ncbi:MAG: restriction endonuclease subunit S, partial [Gammaproteobacteria bacterium]